MVSYHLDCDNTFTQKGVYRLLTWGLMNSDPHISTGWKVKMTLDRWSTNLRVGVYCALYTRMGKPLIGINCRRRLDAKSCVTDRRNFLQSINNIAHIHKGDFWIQLVLFGHKEGRMENKRFLKRVIRRLEANHVWKIAQNWEEIFWRKQEKVQESVISNAQTDVDNLWFIPCGSKDLLMVHLNWRKRKLAR